ncbi:MAG: MarR family transcriptional regulator [Candidatus Altiarchaeales archaeon]|nr:MarR family transcriptional regulator [Candidatus Altiarchaeales archaeon]
MHISARKIGAAIIFASFLMILLLIWFIDTLSSMSRESCTCGDTCGMVYFEVPPTFYLGLLGVCLLLFSGIYLTVKGDSMGETDNKKRWMERLEKLGGEEETVYKLIADAGGTLFQTEISEKTGLSKVKVTRVLDKLESRRLVERRRRGLVNIVVLK